MKLSTNMNLSSLRARAGQLRSRIFNRGESDVTRIRIKRKPLKPLKLFWALVVVLTVLATFIGPLLAVFVPAFFG